MNRFHIRSNGEPGVCKAEISCPLGGSESQHFDSQQAARDHFEAVMGSDYAQPTGEEKTLRDDVRYTQDWMFLDPIYQNMENFKIGDETLENFADLQETLFTGDRSKAVAEFVRWFSDDPETLADGYPLLEPVAHTPLGDRLGERFANIFEQDGRRWVVDYSFSEADPTRPYPYIGTEEEWQLDLDRLSFMEQPQRAVPPYDPRAGDLPKFLPGEHNPLLAESTLEQPHDKRSYGAGGTEVRFLSVRGVRVAAIHYMIHDYGIQIHSIETRQGYQRQGYMKKALADLESSSGLEVYSSGSYTPAGYHTRHLTRHRDGVEPKINWANYTDDDPFSFVNDWVTGHSRS